MTEPIDLPPGFERFADLLSEQPAEVRDLFRYALVLAMIDDEKAHVIGTRVEEERKWLTVETVGVRSLRTCDPRFRRNSKPS
jgi:hypothetical protein